MMIQVIRPIFLSALFLWGSGFIVQQIGLFFDPTFSIIANRGAGKIIFTIIILLNIFCFILTRSASFRRTWLTHNLYFFTLRTWISSFFTYFFMFSALHFLFLIFCLISGSATWQWHVFTLTPRLLWKIIFGFIATFMLAWTEEVMFRGTLYLYFASFWRPIPSTLLTSLCFMLVHDLHNPFNLILKDYKLGIGLFLIGVLLNLIFIGKKNLSSNMGAHAGLVFIKVLLRKMPFIVLNPSHQLVWYLNRDLRQSYVVHTLLIFAIIILSRCYKKDLLSQHDDQAS